MAKTRLLQAVCTVALLAAVPAFAQRPEAGMTAPNGTPNPEATQNGATPAPAEKTSPMGSTASNTPAEIQPPGHAASHRRMQATADRSQDSAVNRLNDESYQAAQRGQIFSNNTSNYGPGNAMSNYGPGASMTPTSSGADGAK